MGLDEPPDHHPGVEVLPEEAEEPRVLHPVVDVQAFLSVRP